MPLREALPRGIANMLDAGDLRARSLAESLGGPPNAQHLLRFTLTEPNGQLIGGYSIVSIRLSRVAALVRRMPVVRVNW